MKRFLMCAAVLLVFGPAQVQAEGGKFKDYNALKGTMDELVQSRQIADLMLAFGGGDEMSLEDIKSLERRVQAIYPRNFSDVTLIRREKLEDNWRQEMWGYYVNSQYFYTYVLIHERAEGTYAVNFKFNTEFDEIFSEF